MSERKHVRFIYESALVLPPYLPFCLLPNFTNSVGRGPLIHNLCLIGLASQLGPLGWPGWPGMVGQASLACLASQSPARQCCFMFRPQSLLIRTASYEL